MIRIIAISKIAECRRWLFHRAHRALLYQRIEFFIIFSKDYIGKMEINAEAAIFHVHIWTANNFVFHET